MTPEHQPGRRLTLLAGYRLRSADRRQSIKRDHARPGDPTDPLVAALGTVAWTSSSPAASTA